MILSNHKDLEKDFDKEIDRLFKAHPASYANIFKKHERKHIVVDNLSRELRQAEIACGHLASPKTRKEIIEFGVNLFCKNVIREKEEQILSDLEVQRRIAEASRIKNLEEKAEYEEKEWEKSQTQTKIYMGDTDAN